MIKVFIFIIHLSIIGYIYLCIYVSNFGYYNVKNMCNVTS